MSMREPYVPSFMPTQGRIPWTMQLSLTNFFSDTFLWWEGMRVLILQLDSSREFDISLPVFSCKTVGKFLTLDL